MFSGGYYEPAIAEESAAALHCYTVYLHSSNFQTYFIFSVELLQVKNTPQMGSVIDTGLCAWVLLIHTGDGPFQSLQRRL